MKLIGPFVIVVLLSVPLTAQSARDSRIFSAMPGAAAADAEIPLTRIALFSSGVGYFQHGGTVQGEASVRLPFDREAVNDALKSLTIADSASGASAAVQYPSEETLEKTLQSLGIDLSGNPGTAEIFAAQRGAEIEVSAPNPVSGRIAGVEYRPAANGEQEEAYLSLFSAGGFRVIPLRDIGSFSFKDPRLNDDMRRALDLIAANRASRSRNLLVTFAAANPGRREVSLSYVIPVPVWKVSYRLDLGNAARGALFQGWAIVDNASDSDWNGVELSLVSGRPVSFIQNLYPPYYLARPVLPLAIAGTAEARSHASGYGRDKNEEIRYDDAEEYKMLAEEPSYGTARKAVRAQPAPSPLGQVNSAASGSAAADQFAFTVNKPVHLPRRQSAMIPLVNGTAGAVKSLILSGAKASGAAIHPELSAELTNTTGTKLPAGPITVYDGGTYAGDALIDFFSENDKRFISYGEDLSVTATAKTDNTRFVSAVTASGGVMTINRRIVIRRVYTVKNAAAESKRLIIEHPISSGYKLTEPAAFLEQTAQAYRFAQNLPAAGEITFTVTEETPVSQTVILGGLSPSALVEYATNQDYPVNVRTALSGAVELQRKADAARQTLAEQQSRTARLQAEQERVRQNLNAVGASSDLGREYMKRMTALDADIDAANTAIEAAELLARNTRAALEAYIAGLNL